MESDKEEFYSNCLVQALKHKIKNKNVTITYIPAKYRGSIIPHFLWSDGEYDYDFGVNYNIKWYKSFWFKGKIRKRGLGWNEKYKNMVMNNHKKKEK